MQVVYERCCGLDIHKKTAVACAITPEGQETRTFGTVTKGLLALADWLAARQVTHVAMESTGVFWKPIYNDSVEGAGANFTWPKPLPPLAVMEPLAPVVRSSTPMKRPWLVSRIVIVSSSLSGCRTASGCWPTAGGRPLLGTRRTHFAGPDGCRHRGHFFSVVIPVASPPH